MTYNATGDKVVDSTGKEWECETVYEGKIPNDWNESRDVWAVYFYEEGRWGARYTGGYTHWLVRRRLPDPPKPKTQEELDEEAENRALVNFMRVNQRDLSEEERYLFFQGHKDGVAYARKG